MFAFNILGEIEQTEGAHMENSCDMGIHIMESANTPQKKKSILQPRKMQQSGVACCFNNKWILCTSIKN